MLENTPTELLARIDFGLITSMHIIYPPLTNPPRWPPLRVTSTRRVRPEAPSPVGTCSCGGTMTGLLQPGPLRSPTC